MYADHTKNLSTPESMHRRNSAKTTRVTWSMKLNSTSTWIPHAFHACVRTSAPAMAIVRVGGPGLNDQHK
uniref:Uncharacterized protein n=1 Tax=Arundo donax TaxID=35708 RepID=A0A0A8Z2G9_ARUDO